MDNADKIELLKLRLSALDKEADTVELFETTARLTMSFQRLEGRFEVVRRLLKDARAAYLDELAARQTSGFFARRTAVSRLREGKQALYGAAHKMANVDIENVRKKVDDFEARLGFDRADSVRFFNTVVKPSAEPGVILPAAAVGGLGDAPEVRIGQYIFIKGADHGLPDAALLAFHVAILACLRRIAQTKVGRRLLVELDKGCDTLKRRRAAAGEGDVPPITLVRIKLEDSADGWGCRADSPGSAAAPGKPTINTIPAARGAPQGAARGTGGGSTALVGTFPGETLSLGSAAGHADNAWIPAHVALFHELTHAVRAVTGKQDHTYLSARPSQMGNTYAHRGFWYTNEEKATVAAEKDYSEEAGFNLKRVNYGALGERIDG